VASRCSLNPPVVSWAMVAHMLLRKPAAHFQVARIFTLAERAALHSLGVVLKNGFACPAGRNPKMSPDTREALLTEQRRTLMLCFETAFDQGLQAAGLVPTITPHNQQSAANSPCQAAGATGAATAVSTSREALSN